MRSVLLAVSMALMTGVATPETLLTLSDFEGTTSSWSNTTMTTGRAHSGTQALEWRVWERPSLDSPRFVADWTKFDELRFWAYSEKAWDFKIPIVFPSEGGYFIIDWTVDWEGWKEQTIKLADCKRAHDPVGWQDIFSLGFRPQGYGQGPVPEGLTLILDDFALHSPEDLPATSLDEWIARERKERIMKLKAQGNPYYGSIYESLKNAKPEPSLPEKMPSSWSLSGLTTNALAAAWAAGFDGSPRKGDEVLISHAVGLIDFCLEQQKDGSWFYSREWEQRADPNSDRFALGPLMDAVWWLRQLPGMEENWKRWEGPLRQMADFQYVNWWKYDEMGFTDNTAWGSSSGTYPNQDVFHLFEMAVAYEWWKDDKYLESAQGTLQALWDHLLPDGGLHYIGPETEIPTYHDLNILWIARYYKLTGDESARELLAKTAPYYPLVSSSEGRPEYYSDCWWKHYWGDGKACGPEIIAGITGDGQNKWLANRLIERTGTGGGYQAIYAGMFYRDDVAETPLPDNWVKIDRNIDGPRGRFGDWYFAGTVGGGARDTFVGAMVAESDSLDPLKGAFMAANIEVALGGEGARDRTHLYCSGSDDITSTAIHGDLSAIAARYSPRKPYINSVAGNEIPPTPWLATQVWLMTPAGLVGLVELEPTEEQTVPYLGGELRFGPDLPLALDDQGVYHCGAVVAKLLDHNFGSVEHGPARPGYAQQSTKHSAAILRTSGESFTAKPGEPVHYAVAVAPRDLDAIGAFTRIEAAGLWAFQVSVAGKPCVVAFNPGDAAADIELLWQAAVQTGGEKLRPIPNGVAVTVAPRKVAIITTPDTPKFGTGGAK